MRRHPMIGGGGPGPAVRVAPPAGYVSSQGPPSSFEPIGSAGLTAAAQPLMERVATTGTVESGEVARAWEMYEKPEVRFACRQYSNAFSSAKLVLGRRKVLWEDPEPVLEPSTREESKAFELLQSFAGGAVGQHDLLDRMGTYFVVPGDMVLAGAYDPAHLRDSKYAKWDLYSTSEVKWNGQRLQIQTSDVEDHWQVLPDYVRHTRVWNRHPRWGWKSDSPVLSAIQVLELIGIYDDRLYAESVSRLVGAGVWMLPQGMKLPTTNGGMDGTPQDFLKLMMEVAKIAIKDRRSAAANVPIMVEAAAEDILAAKEGHLTFWSKFDENIGELQERAIRRWATGVDLPAEEMLGLAQATHWNASLISEDKVQSFVVPSLRRAVGNLTAGWLHPAMAQFNLTDPSLELWFDASAIKVRVDHAEEAQWGHERFLVSDADAKTATGLSHTGTPSDEQIKRQMLLHMARSNPETVPDVLRELGIAVAIASPAAAGAAEERPRPSSGRQGPQADQVTDTRPSNGSSPGRGATLSTTGK